MRKMNKGEAPEVLNANREQWTRDYKVDLANATKRYRYRHPDIKKALKQETHDKCAYCESKIGHNTPGDIEHKIPSSVDVDRHFDWENITIACAECNRRKNDYFDEEKPFLDPYVDDVESRLVHLGPLVSWTPLDEVAEITVKILELDTVARTELIQRKVEWIDTLNNVVERLGRSDPLMRALLVKSLEKLTSPANEYSGMLLAVCRDRGLLPNFVTTSAGDVERV